MIEKGFVMIDSRLMTIQQYAIRYQMSTFAVIKQINSGKLKTIKEMVDGEQKEFIIDDEAVADTVASPVNTPPTQQAPSRPTFLKSEEAYKNQDSSVIDYKEKYEELLERYNNLIDYKAKYEELLKKYDYYEQKARMDELMMNSM